MNRGEKKEEGAGKEKGMGRVTWNKRAWEGERWIKKESQGLG